MKSSVIFIGVVVISVVGQCAAARQFSVYGDPEEFEDEEDDVPKEDDRICPKGKYYHELTEKCYTLGKRGPCPETMEFRKDPRGVGTDGTKYGKDEMGRCDCERKPLGDACTRPMIYSTTFDRCYYIFSQGPCEFGQWFVPEIEVPDFRFPYIGECKKMNCPVNGTGISFGNDSSGDFVYEWLGRCYRTFTSAHCDASYVSVFLRHGDTSPHCVPDGWFEKFYPACSKKNREIAEKNAFKIPASELGV